MNHSNRWECREKDFLNNSKQKKPKHPDYYKTKINKFHPSLRKLQTRHPEFSLNKKGELEIKHKTTQEDMQEAATNKEELGSCCLDKDSEIQRLRYKPD